MEYLLPIIIVLVLLWIITRPFTTLFHELGHAIPVMILTKQGATVFIGSYGDKKYSFKLKLWQLDIWFRYNPIKWHGGVCIPKAEKISINKKMIYILCGPILSFLIAAIICYFTFVHDMHGSLKMICVFAFGSTIFDLFINLMPSSGKFADGSMMYSDGYALLYLKKVKKFSKEYTSAIELYNNKEYEKAAPLFQNFLTQGFYDEDVYRFASTSYFFIKNYERANSLQKEFDEKFQLNSDDYYNFGLTCSFLHLDEANVLYLQKSLELNPENHNSLNAVGYNLNTKNKYVEAIPYFDKAIELKPDFAYAYNNRGHAKIESGKLEEGLYDINYSLQLDKENSYVYRNLGIYHLAKNEKEEAFQFFTKAKSIDKDTDLIEELITKTTI